MSFSFQQEQQQQDLPVTLHGDRLLWIERERERRRRDNNSSSSNGTLWWPAYRYDSYGHALKALASSKDVRLDARLKSFLTLQFMRHPKVPVARLLGSGGGDKEPQEQQKLIVLPLAEASDTAHQRKDKDALHASQHVRSHDFYQYIEHLAPPEDCANADQDERKEAMDELFMLLAQDVETTSTTGQRETQEPHARAQQDGGPSRNKHRGNATAVSTTSTTVIHSNDSWPTVWSKLRSMGWKKKITKTSGNECWVFPGASRSRGTHGIDYYKTLDELQAYVKREYGWNGAVVPVLSSATNKNDKRQQQQPQTKKRAHSRPAKKQDSREDSGRIWGRAPPPTLMTTSNSTPVNQRTHPQDPSKPRLDSDDDEDSVASSSSSSSLAEEDRYNWRILWDELKLAGWTAVRATRYNILHDWYYVRPRCTVANGVLGRDYFSTTDDVICYCRFRDQQANGDFDENDRRRSGSLFDDAIMPTMTSSSVVVMPSPRKRSRKHKRDQQDRVGSTTTTTTRPAPRAAKKPKKAWWFHDEPLPSFRQVWAILHRKLGFLYTNGCYKLPIGTNNDRAHLSFATDLDMRCHLVEHGIPNLVKASTEERTILERWVAFCHVPVKDANSIVKLHGMQELSDAQASRMLIEGLAFVQLGRDGGDVGYKRGPQVFRSLQEARDFFRSASSLALAVEGGRRRNREQSESIAMSDDEILQFRVWAALSSTPLPEARVVDSSSLAGESDPVTSMKTTTTRTNTRPTSDTNKEKETSVDQKEEENAQTTDSTMTTQLPLANDDPNEERGDSNDDKATNGMNKKGSAVLEFLHDEDEDTSSAGEEANHRRITMSPSKMTAMLTQPSDESNEMEL